MEAVKIRDKKEIYSFLIKNKYLHIYSLGDLDDFFWNYTRWFGLKDGNNLLAVSLLYSGLAEPTLLALSDKLEPMEFLLKKTLNDLPPEFYAHLTPGLSDLFGKNYQLTSRGMHYKMALMDQSRMDAAGSVAAIRFGKNDEDELVRFYEQAYPGNWFDARMLESGHYFGLKNDGQITAAAGVHVYSRAYKIAALGNIATHPAYRGRGLGKNITAHCCRELLKTVETIGLNVNIANLPAVTIYKQLGFEPVAIYEEYIISKKA